MRQAVRPELGLHHRTMSAEDRCQHDHGPGLIGKALRNRASRGSIQRAPEVTGRERQHPQVRPITRFPVSSAWEGALPGWRMSRSSRVHAAPARKSTSCASSSAPGSRTGPPGCRPSTRSRCRRAPGDRAPSTPTGPRSPGRRRRRTGPSASPVDRPGSSVLAEQGRRRLVATLLADLGEGDQPVTDGGRRRRWVSRQPCSRRASVEVCGGPTMQPMWSCPWTCRWSTVVAASARSSVHTVENGPWLASRLQDHQRLLDGVQRRVRPPTRPGPR